MTREEFLKKLEGSKITDHNPVDPKFHSETPSTSVKKQWVLDVQWSDCPQFVEDEARKLWRDYGIVILLYIIGSFTMEYLKGRKFGFIGGGN